MNRREQIKDFILLLQKSEREVKPYYDLLGDSLSIYETLYETQTYAAKLLHISDDGEYSDWDFIYDFAIFGYVNFEGEKVEDIERFLDLYLQYEGVVMDE